MRDNFDHGPPPLRTGRRRSLDTAAEVNQFLFLFTEVHDISSNNLSNSFNFGRQSGLREVLKASLELVEITYGAH